MDLAFSPEQDELVRTLRHFARRELAPRSAHWDRTGEFPWEAWRRMGELGLLGLRVPEAYGGQAADFLTFGIAMEEIGRGDFSCTYGIQLAGLAGEILGRSGTEEIKTRWLPPTASGLAVVALALTEPGAGSDAANLACRAERDGDGYVITGEKSGISLGMAAQAAIVFARTDPGGRARGVTAFVVPLDLPGVSRSPLRDMGTRAIGRAVLAFDRVRLPVSHRLGEEGTGFYQVMQGFDYNRIGIALACLGVAQQSVEETMGYVKERKAFGRALARFEGVSFAIAEAATHLEACRWLCYRALWLADQGRPHTKESAMTKWWGPRLAVDTIHQCLLLHGHYGYTDELPFEQRMRDVIGLEIGDGAAEVMKMVVARELMGRESLPY
ncbi:MAG TPA: acyl-CoA dehydrogenase family protein [Candidatus Udaeobacter sp.]|jgi:cyclohexanecarboxyl-CoA dehydrogenase|nr:acyl-CoA dehydrogenase family protein [Candidatus Udaeobacter sp.]